MDELPKKRRGPLGWLADRSLRWWIGAALLPIVYIASFGPACWLDSRLCEKAESISSRRVATAIYLPILKIANHGPVWLNSSLSRYAAFGATKDWLPSFYCQDANNKLESHLFWVRYFGTE